MRKIHLMILTVVFSKCLAERNLQDNKKRYIGSGADTPRFDPNNYAFKYSGVSFGSKLNQFVPSFMNDNSINKLPNYENPAEATSPLDNRQNATNENAADKNKPDETTNTFSIVQDARGSSPDSNIPEFLSQTFPDNIMSTLKINASSMFPNVKFSGQPGMLGIGSQVQVQIVGPVNSPVQNHQYLPLSLRNVSETHITSQAFDQSAGVGDTKSVSGVGAKTNTHDLSKPLYSGYPGMLGVGQMVQNIDNSGSDPNIGKNEDNIANQQNKTGGMYTFNSISVKAGVNANNWKGEWPGKKSSGDDWSGNWSEKWPKTGNNVKDGKDSPDSSKTDGFMGQQSSQIKWDGSWPESRNNVNDNKDSPDNSKTGGFTSTKIEWDGSWPGSTQKEATTTKALTDTGNFGETMASLKKLMNILKQLTSSVDNRSDKPASTSFSQMVAGWKEEMKPQR